MIANRSARRWTRAFLALALLVSVVGNVAHTALADSSISLWLRIPGAVVWPVFTFGGVEIIVRMVWERSWTHRIARNILLLPAIPAAITSYEHLRSLLLMMGERDLIAWIGPAGIDGMMIGCTMILMFTRPEKFSDLSADDLLLRWERQPEENIPVSSPPYIPSPEEMLLAENFSADDGEPSPPARRTSPSPRTSPWDASKVTEMILEGSPRGEVLRTTGIASSAYGHMVNAVRLLKENPRGELPPTVRVSAGNVGIIRELVSK